MFKSTRTAATLAVLILLACAAMAAAQAPAVAPAPPAVPIQWMGNLINMQGGGTAFLTVRAYDFTPPAVVDALKDMLKAQGQTAVVNELNAMPAIGYLQFDQSLSTTFPLCVTSPPPPGIGSWPPAPDRSGSPAWCGRASSRHSTPSAW